MAKLAYLDIAKSGYRLVYYNWQSMVRLGFVPFAIVLGVALVNAVLGAFVSSSAATGNAGAAAGFGFLSLLLNLVLLAAIVPFLVGWHRFTFEVADRHVPAVVLAVAKTELIYFGYLIAFGVVSGILYAIGAAILGAIFGSLLLTGGDPFGAIIFGVILLVVVMPGVLYLSMRFAFVFPEIALGRRTNPMQSWRQTAKDHVELWLLGLAFVVPMIVVGIAISILGLVFALIPALGAALTIVLHVVAMAIYIAFVAAFTSALTLAYKEVVG